MKVCGVVLSSHDAIIVVLDGTRSSWKWVDCEPRKISLPDDEDAIQVRAFSGAVTAFVKHHGIQRVAIKKRAKKGDYAGGAVSFKMEGVIQLSESCEVVLLPPQTIARISRKNKENVPAELSQYRHDAFFAALTALGDE